MSEDKENEATDIEVIEKKNNIQPISYTRKEIELIKNMYAKNATDEEFALFMYMARVYVLDPLKKEIWCVKYRGQPAQIYASRDGHLKVAHSFKTKNNEPAFDGMESGTKGSIKEGNLKGWCRVYRKDMSHSFYVEVDFDEYNTNQALWKTKPKTMIQKVAESQCLRRAFAMHGFYSEEEMGQWELEQRKLAQENNKTKDKSTFDWSKLDDRLDEKPKWNINPKTKKRTAPPPIIKRLFAIGNKYFDSKELKKTFYSITNKEHSYEYTYGDIKKIDEFLTELEQKNDENNDEIYKEFEEKVLKNEEENKQK
jgi:phage recombination protein Bet